MIYGGMLNLTQLLPSYWAY